MTHAPHHHDHPIEETALTIGGSVFGSIFSHLICCGLLPMALNASAGALLSSLGVQIGFAIASTLLVASAVTLFEKRRHHHACNISGHNHCAPHFNLRRHFLRNLAVGIVVYTTVYGITHIPAVHHVLEKYILI